MCLGVRVCRQMGNEIIKRREAKIEGGEKDTNQDPNFVKELLALHDKYMAVVNEQFAGNSLLQKALKEVGRSVVGFLALVFLSSSFFFLCGRHCGRFLGV